MFRSRKSVIRSVACVVIIIQVILQYGKILNPDWLFAMTNFTAGGAIYVNITIHRGNEDRHEEAADSGIQNATTTNNSRSMIMEDPDLPLWMKEYLSWHVEMREQFPGDELMHHPDAPNLLVRVCFKFCGGLNDRLGQLPWDIYLAARTKRILLIYWARPTPLEDYLHPNIMNFTFPDRRWFPTNGTSRVPDHYYHYVCQKAHNIFHGFESDRPSAEFFTSHFDQAVNHSLADDDNRKTLRFELVGHIGEHFLKTHIQNTFQSDIDVTEAPVFGKLFHLFFKPSPQLDQALTEIRQKHPTQLIPGQYSAAHCRVRHPFSGKNGARVKAINPKFTADHVGLAWHDNDEGRHQALTDAVQAFSCLSHHHNTQPVYFFSDSSDLVKFVSSGQNLTHNNETYQPKNDEERKVQHQLNQFSIVSRDDSDENVHIDKQVGLNVSAYYGTFLDLYLAIDAKCIVYGIGKFAYFASKISGTSCRYVYRQEPWGRGGKRTETISEECKSNLIIPEFKLAK